MKKTAFFLMLTCIIPLLILASIEVLLRFINVQSPTAFFKESWIQGEKFYIPNASYTQRFFPKAVARSPHPFKIPAIKPHNAFRIFVLGGSAAMGDPETSIGISHQLEHMLKGRLDTPFIEVHNLAITAINSHIVRQILNESLHLKPDAVILYLGNNEIVGPFGQGSIFGKFTKSLGAIRFHIYLSGLQLFQMMKTLMAHILPRPSDQITEWKGMEFFLNKQISAGNTELLSTYSFFKQNICDMVQACIRRDINVILCTVAVNLKDNAPFASMHLKPLSETSTQIWDSLFNEGKACLHQKNYPLARGAFEKAAAIDRDHAELQYLTGCMFSALSDHQNARICYSAARDLDTLKFRADSRINQIIKDTPSVIQHSLLHLVDVESLLDGKGSEVPGFNYFYDHVHLNMEGNFKIASALTETLFPLIKEALKLTPSGDSLSVDEIKRQTGFSTWHEHETLKLMQWRFQKPPFTFQSNASHRMELFTRASKRLKSLIDHPMQTKSLVTNLAGVFDMNRHKHNFSFLDNYARLLEAAGHENLQTEILRFTHAQFPFAIKTMENLAAVLLRQKKYEDAISIYRQILDLNDDSPTVYCNLGLGFYSKGDIQMALKYYHMALDINPDHKETLANLGNLYLHLGDLTEAQRTYHQILSISPDYLPAMLGLSLVKEKQEDYPAARHILENILLIQSEHPQALYQLGMISLKEDQTAEAISLFKKLIHSDVRNTLGYLELGKIYLTQKQYYHAEVCFRKALEIDTQSDTLHYVLGNTLSYLQKQDESKKHFDEALRLNPKNSLAMFKLGVWHQEQRLWSPAIEHFKNVTALESENWQAHNRLSMIYSEDDVFDPEKALWHSQKALSISREQDPLVLNTRAILLAKLGRYTEASLHISRAISMTDHNLSPDFYQYLKLFHDELQLKIRSKG